MNDVTNNDDQKKRRFAKARRSAVFLGRWGTPFGILQTVYIKRVKSLELQEIAHGGDVSRLRIDNWIGIITGVLLLVAVAGGFIWLSTSESGSSLSIGGAVIFSAGILFFLKLLTHIKNLRFINSWMAGEGQKIVAEYAEIKNAQIEYSDEARSILLFRYNTYKNIYYLTAALALAVFLTPQNIQGMLWVESMQIVTIVNTLAVSSITTLILIAILLLRAFLCRQDIKRLKITGASPTLQGHLTLRSQIPLLLSYSGFVVALAFFGELGAKWIAGGGLEQALPWLSRYIDPLWPSAIIRVALLAYMLFVSFNVFRTSSVMSGLQTARHGDEVGLLPIVLLGTCRLPPPQQTEAEPLDGTVATALCVALLGAAAYVASNSGWVGLITVIGALPPLAVIFTSISHDNEPTGEQSEQIKEA